MQIADSTTAESATGEIPAEIVADEADGHLFRMAETLADISTRIPGGLWYHVHLRDMPGMGLAPATADIEIATEGAEPARQIADALPWAGRYDHFVQPGLTNDHWTWRGVVGDFRVLVLGLEPLRGGEQS